MQRKNNNNVGGFGETRASAYLKSKNFNILETNFKARYGEIDIIAIEPSSPFEKDQTLVFIEVKTRKSSEFGSPLEAITPWKLRSVVKTAQFYKLTHKNLPDLMRIDGIGIKLADNGEVIDIEHVKNISGF